MTEAGGKAKLLQLPEKKSGLFDIQDESSQVMSMEVGCQPGDKVLDFCAGSGGKALVFGAKFMQYKQVLYGREQRNSLCRQNVCVYVKGGGNYHDNHSCHSGSCGAVYVNEWPI